MRHNPSSMEEWTFPFSRPEAGTEQQDSEKKEREAEMTKNLPGRWKLAAVLLAFGIVADLPWLHKGAWAIIAIRMGMSLSCLATAWISGKCRTKDQADWTVIGGTLLAAVGFALLGTVEEIYYNYTLAVYQILVFVIIFLPLRNTMYAILLFLTGLLWFGLLPWMLGQLHRFDLWYGHFIGYFTYATMLLAGNVLVLRLRRLEWERRINLVERAKQLEARTEEMIKENDRRYERLLKVSPEPALLHKGDTVHFANDAFLKLNGISRLEEIQGTSVLAFFQPEQRSQATEQFAKAVQGDSLQFHEFRLVTKNRGIIEVEACSFAVTNHAEKQLVQTLFRDLSARKRMEEKLGRSDKLSHLGQMAAGVAHEIRNPLTSLKGFVKLLRSRNSEYSSYYDIMTAELDRINRIVDEFMLIAKPHQVEFKKQRTDSILDHVTTLIEPQAKLSNIKLHKMYEHDVPAVLCDENQLKQVFINLLKNAIEAMPSGGSIIIHLSRKEDQVSVMIRDEGIGIPDEKLAKLGEPFFTTKENGTGLGLNICFRIVEAHRGKMFIRSKLNQGTTVEIVLPFA